ncbi:hypothetical protein N665_0057s0044 [Sinapis alba]|nr:hypothetical protein N665_0057s0044 [Sinapis alba]
MWVVWNPKVRVTPCYKSEQLITCSILLEGQTEEIFCSFVYALNPHEERVELWEDLKFHQNSPLMKYKPWLVLGDFNEILDTNEHSVEGHVTTTGMRDFQDMICHCHLSDMSYQGPRMTWCNKRDADLICKKLDRALINEIWSQNFPHMYCVFELGGCSDHLRCRLMLKP